MTHETGRRPRLPPRPRRRGLAFAIKLSLFLLPIGGTVLLLVYGLRRDILILSGGREVQVADRGRPDRMTVPGATIESHPISGALRVHVKAGGNGRFRWPGLEVEVLPASVQVNGRSHVPAAGERLVVHGDGRTEIVPIPYR